MGLFGSSKTATPQTVRHTAKFVKDAGGASAVSFDKIKNVDLRKKAEGAGVSLRKVGLSGIRAEAVLLLDYSGSMGREYSDGTVQAMVERVLGFALNIDIDGTVPVIPFASGVLPTVDVTLANYSGVVDREIVRKHRMGSTDLTGALNALKKLAEKTKSPIFALVVTDGNPDSKATATKVVCELASYPVFVKFVAIADVPYLRELDEDPDVDRMRLLDNVSAVSLDPRRASDSEFADKMAQEWPDWIARATSAGILT